jgi:hypothetical protein
MSFFLQGSNLNCFFSSVDETGAIAGITTGVIVAIVVAAVVAALLGIFFSKRGYDYYKAKNDLNSAGLQSNPMFVENQAAGTMV